MTKNKLHKLKLLILYAASSLILVSGCNDIYEQELYKNPDWLAGKVYTQVAAEEDLSQFAECLQITGYDSLLDKSGSFTIFAPTNDAVESYLANNQFSSVSDIPKSQLEKLVKFHIIQDAWSTNQLQMLDREGWIDPEDPESEPRAYKRQTLLKNPNEKYWVRREKERDVIVLDSTQADRYKTVYTRSRKYVPIFFDEYFEIYNLSSEDYNFYFGRDYEPGGIFYANGKVMQSEIFAENGFVFKIDQVVEPMLNARELLERELPDQSYKRFLSLIYEFPEFRSNLEETYDQAASRAGESFDTLYNLTFPNLPFDLHEEITGPNIYSTEYTYTSHNGIYVPTDEAFQRFIDDVVTQKSGYPHWGDFESVPLDIKQIIVQTHFTNTPVFPSNMSKGFKDGKGNIIFVNEGDVIHKEFGSNCTFMGLDKTVVPRAFSSVAGPVYLRPGYSTFMYAMQKSKVIGAVTKENANYSFFPVSDEVMLQDSSLIFNWVDRDLNRYSFSAFDRANQRKTFMSPGILGRRILNQVGTSLPNGSASKEFIETLGGNYIIWDNTDNTVQGTRANTFGYRGDSVIYYTPQTFEEPTDNGTAYDVKTWFSFSKTELYSILFSRYRYFVDLLEKAGLYDTKLYEFPFLIDGESYTIFIPSEQALSDYQVDTLAVKELEKLLRFHFVRGDKIFTDNKKSSQAYETLRKDESSSKFSTVYSNLKIRPGPDVIDILDANDNLYLSIVESAEKTNIMVAYDTDDESSDDTDFITSSVIHEIDKVLDHSILK